MIKKQDSYLKQADLMAHANAPQNYGLLSVYDFMSEQYNPSCGDSIVMCGLIQDETITEVRFEGRGCMLSQAMASKLTEYAKQKTIGQVLALDQEIVQELLAMQLGLNRMQCGMLSVLALQAGLKKYTNS